MSPNDLKEEDISVFIFVRGPFPGNIPVTG
jgi:hypothetical protein